jgi:phage terminase small subunit
MANGLTNKQKVFVEAYLRTWNASEAARQAGYSERTAGSQGHELLKKPEIQEEIERRLEELTMSAPEVLARLTEHARSDLGVFFKTIEEWTEYPLPSYEVIDAKEVIEPAEEGKEPEKHTLYWVRHVALDMDKLTQPEYSHLVRKFKDSPKDGLSVELYDAQAALKLLGQKHGLFKDKLELSGKDGGPIQHTISLEDMIQAQQDTDTWERERFGDDA